MKKMVWSYYEIKYLTVYFNLAIDHRSCHVIVAIQTQALDIAQKVHEGKALEEVGAGDQVKFCLSLH